MELLVNIWVHVFTGLAFFFAIGLLIKGKETLLLGLLILMAALGGLVAIIVPHAMEYEAALRTPRALAFTFVGILLYSFLDSYSSGELKFNGWLLPVLIPAILLHSSILDFFAIPHKF